MAHIELRDVIDAAVLTMAGLSALIHACGLDQRAWAKPILAVSTDLVGAYKRLTAAPPEPPK